MAKYAVSDIHGQSAAFDAVLAAAGFSDSDELYVLGDVIDRGPDGIGLLRRILAAPNMHMILGNHEEMMLKAFRGSPEARRRYGAVWRDNGGDVTERAFLALQQAEREEILDALAALPEWLDADAGGTGYRLVHASWSLDRNTRLWDAPSPFQPARANDGRRIVVGHTPTMLFDVNPRRYLRNCGAHMNVFRCEGFIGIDCGAGLPANYRKRALSYLRLDDGAEFYAAV